MMVDTGDFPFVGPPSPGPGPPPPAFPAVPPHSYATLTPLQPLPPLNAIPEEFGFVSSDGFGGVSGSFTVMQANAPPGPHCGSYGYRGGYYDMQCEQQPAPHAPHPPPPSQPPQQCYEYREAYCQQDYYPVSVKSELPIIQHYGSLRDSVTPPSPATGLHQSSGGQPGQPAPTPAGPQPNSTPQQAVVVKAEPLGASGCGHQQAQEAEEINTKELAQRISAELKRYSIPQAIFAQRVLCRSQGTLSDLLRNPKPWSKLKSGRETFRRMWKWLQEPEHVRMSALRLAATQIPQRTACKRNHHGHPIPHDRKQRLLFADLQRYF